MKETIRKVKRQPSEWEKIIANETTDKELISKIYKQFMQLNTRKVKNPRDKSKVLFKKYCFTSPAVGLLGCMAVLFPVF